MRKSLFLFFLISSLFIVEVNAKKEYDLKWNISPNESISYDVVQSDTVSGQDPMLDLFTKDYREYFVGVFESIRKDYKIKDLKISFSCSTPGIVDVVMTHKQPEIYKDFFLDMKSIVNSLKKDSLSAQEKALVQYLETGDEKSLEGLSEEDLAEMEDLIKTFKESKKQEEKTIVSLRGSVCENGDIHSFWTKSNQMNLLSLFAQLPNKKVVVGESWPLDVKLINCDQNFTCKSSSHKNMVTLKKIQVVEGEVVAVLNYDILESVQGVFDMSLMKQMSSINPLMNSDSVKDQNDLSIEMKVEGDCYFSITKGRWKDFQMVIRTRKNQAVSAQVYSFKGK